MAISFVETTPKSTTWPVRLDTDLASLEIDNVFIGNSPRGITLTTISPGIRGIGYSTWDFIFSGALTEAERNNLTINVRGIFRIQLLTNPDSLATTDFNISGEPSGVTLSSIEKVRTDGTTSIWQLKFSRILTQTELDAITISADASGALAGTEIDPNITEFGISEDNPRAIAYHQGKMYFVGDDTDGLYTLDLNTGQASSVGSPNPTTYGITDLEIRDLASDGTNLYGLGKITTVGSPEEALYTLDTTTGAASQVGSASRFGLSSPFQPDPVGLAWAGSSNSDDLYMIGTQTHRLYTINKNTGVATAVGDLSSSDVNRSLDYINSILYALSDSPNAGLFKIDTSSRVVTRLGTQTNFGLTPGEQNPEGIAHRTSSGTTTAYMVGSGTDKLYQLTLTGLSAGQAQLPLVNKSLKSQPQTVSTTYLRIRISGNIAALQNSDLSISGLPPGVMLVSIIKESSGTNFSIWDLRFSRDLTRLEINALVITVTGTGLTDPDGNRFTDQLLLDSTNYINPSTRLPTNSQSFFDGVRYLLSVDLTEDDLPNEVIAHDAYLGSAARFVAAQLKLTSQSVFDGYSDDYKSRILNAIQNRVAAKLVPALPQIIEAEILESQVRYAEVDWQQKIVLLLNEATSLIDDLTPEEDLYGSGISPFTKTGICVSF